MCVIPSIIILPILKTHTILSQLFCTFPLDVRQAPARFNCCWKIKAKHTKICLETTTFLSRAVQLVRVTNLCLWYLFWDQWQALPASVTSLHHSSDSVIISFESFWEDNSLLWLKLSNIREYHTPEWPRCSMSLTELWGSQHSTIA